MTLTRTLKSGQTTVRLERADGTLIGRVHLADLVGGRARLAFEFGPEVVVIRDELPGPPGAKEARV